VPNASATTVTVEAKLALYYRQPAPDEHRLSEVPAAIVLTPVHGAMRRRGTRELGEVRCAHAYKDQERRGSEPKPTNEPNGTGNFVERCKGEGQH
jgi:hypothetical protein